MFRSFQPEAPHMQNPHSRRTSRCCCGCLRTKGECSQMHVSHACVQGSGSQCWRAWRTLRLRRRASWRACWPRCRAASCATPRCRATATSSLWRRWARRRASLRRSPRRAPPSRHSWPSCLSVQPSRHRFAACPLPSSHCSCMLWSVSSIPLVHFICMPFQCPLSLRTDR